MSKARKSAQQTRPSAFFWTLVVSSVLVIGAGVWQLNQNHRASAAPQTTEAASSLPPVAPDFRLTSASGSQLHLSDLRGKVVLLNFWATWCPPCKAEMPDLEAIQKEYGAERNFTVVAVNIQEDQAAVQQFGTRYGLSFPLLLDPDGQVSDAEYSIRSLPTSIIIDREGHVRDQWLGQQTREAMLQRLARIW